jgi:uncharacterized protein
MPATAAGAMAATLAATLAATVAAPAPITLHPKPLTPPIAAFGFGQTRHARTWPAVNRFALGTVFVRLPMRTLMAQAPQRLGLFGINRAALMGFRDRDHGPRSAAHGSALAWVDSVLQAHGIFANALDQRGEVWLHTFPSVLGYAFKPVSVWFCHAANGSLSAVLAEVHNTFGEQHTYLLRHSDGTPLRDGQTVHAHKMFHVSPFFPVRGHYQFRWLVKPQQSVLRIDYLDAQHQPAAPDAISLSTSISGQHRAISVVSCIRALLVYPAQAFSVVARIHWQAAKLWVKRVPFFRLPAQPAQAVTISHTISHTTRHTSNTHSSNTAAPNTDRR